MGKIFRFYNQNRLAVWVLAAGALFVILVIYTLNSLSKEQNKKEQELAQNGESVQIKDENYENQSQSMVSEDDVPSSYQKSLGSVIDNFLNYCKNHEPEKAYGLLTQECRDLMYPTEELFIDQYYKPKFSTEKTYKFQSWSSTDVYIYLVKIYPNMLITAEGSNQNYIQEYITARKENDTYKVNVNGLVGVSHRDGSTIKNDVGISVESTEIYMDYEIANIVIENNSANDIILDTNERTDGTYLEDKNGVKYEARLYENFEEDLTIKQDEVKELKIKYSHPYQAGNRTAKYVFSNIKFNDSLTDEIMVEI